MGSSLPQSEETKTIMLNLSVISPISLRTLFYVGKSSWILLCCRGNREVMSDFYRLKPLRCSSGPLVSRLQECFCTLPRSRRLEQAGTLRIPPRCLYGWRTSPGAPNESGHGRASFDARFFCCESEEGDYLLTYLPLPLRSFLLRHQTFGEG